MQPSISIAIPAYNAEATLSQTVESVRCQTFHDWELVICDDGSTDGTAQLADALAASDPRIVVVHQENRGSGGAYNTAVRHSGSSLIVMLSADDLLLPEHLGTLHRVAEANTDCGIFTCDGYYEYEDGSREPVRAGQHWKSRGGCTLAELLLGSLYGVGAAFRRVVFEQVGGFREDTYAEDYDFWLKAMSFGFTHCHMDVPLSVHRRSRVQKSSDALAMRESDLRVVTDLLASRRLSPDEHTLAEDAVARLRRNIRIRKAGRKLLGAELTERLIGLMRRHR